ncbi:MAG: alpha/beta hydrolase [Myxococcota bacterium]
MRQGGAVQTATSPAPDVDEWLDGHVSHRRVDVGPVELHVAEAGAGSPVVLLHGFPEFWYGYRRQFRPLVEAGHRVIAPDLRGYNLSDRPAGVDAYRMDLVARDIHGLVEAITGTDERVDVVSHDWGTTVAWLYVMQHQSRVRRFVALAGPEPWYMSRSLRWTQFRKHPYFFLFQYRFAEKLFARNDHAAVRQVFTGDERTPGAFEPSALDRYVEAFARPGATTAALNYYRAIKRIDPSEVRALQSPLAIPVMLLLAAHDRYVDLSGAHPGEEWCRPRIETIDDSSHWLLTDAAAQVNELLLDFLG